MPLSRAEMEQVIRSGGSVLHGGTIINRIELLPAEAQLAKGNPEQEAAAVASLQAQMADIQRQLASLQPQQAAGDEQAAGDDADTPDADLDSSKREKK